MESSLRILPHPAFTVLMGCVVIVTVGTAIYHLTHGGPGSGSSELAMSVLLVLSACLIRQKPREDEAGSRPRSQRLGIGIILVVALLLIAFSIYHLLTHGWPSAIIEASLAILLFLADYVALAKLQGNQA
jgi:hypothetical protein